jgi:hypothetical protein
MARFGFPFSYTRRHPGSTRAGNIGFYTVVGVGAVVLLIMLGLFFVAQGALQGMTEIVKPAVS